MNSDALKKLFDEVKRGKLSPDEAVQRLKHLPFEDLGFANVDHHRTLRVGMPEVIFGPGKSPQQFAGDLRASRETRPQRAGDAGFSGAVSRSQTQAFAKPRCMNWRAPSR